MNTLSDENLLERVLTGELSESDPQVAQRCESSEAFAAELLELRSLVGRLNRAGSEERETLSNANRLTATPGLELVDSGLRGLAQSEPHTTAPPVEANVPSGNVLSGPWVRWAAAAAGLLFAFLLGSKVMNSPSGDGSEYAGSVELEALNLRIESGAAAGSRVLAWDAPLGEGEVYVVRLYREGVLKPLTDKLDVPQWPIPTEFVNLESLSATISIETDMLVELASYGPFELSELE